MDERPPDIAGEAAGAEPPQRRQGVELEQGAAASVSGIEVELEQSAAALVRAENAEVEESAVFMLFGRQVDLRRSNVFLLLAPSVKGDARILFDWRGALILVGGIAVIRTIFRLWPRREKESKYRRLVSRLRSAKLKPS